MAAYLLFAEGETAPGGILERLGLADAFSGENAMTWMECPKGPEGRRGLLGFWLSAEMAGLAGFNAAQQRWLKVPGEQGPPLWLGTWNDHPLRPRDIQRLKTFEPSLPAVLEDGNAWQIPVAKWLPHRWGQNDAGQFVRTPAAEFAEFCREAEVVYQYFVSRRDDAPMIIECQWSYVCRALALNYLLEPRIISALGLVGDRSGGRILAATVEMTLIEAVEDEKKNPPA